MSPYQPWPAFNVGDGELNPEVVRPRVAAGALGDLTDGFFCSDEHFPSAESFFLEHDVRVLEILHNVPPNDFCDVEVGGENTYVVVRDADEAYFRAVDIADGDVAWGVDGVNERLPRARESVEHPVRSRRQD